MFAFTADDRWKMGIGDPTVMGWLTVVAYWTAALLCYRSARAVGSRSEGTGPDPSRSRIFWRLCAFFLIALGINKQLDLQTWFTFFAKQLAQQQGWYEQRRIVQVVFIMLVAAVGAGMLIVLSWLVKGSSDHSKLALMGGLFLAAFVLIRASSFHHVDQMLGFKIGGLKMNWLFELSGIGCVALAAALSTRFHQHGLQRPKAT